MKRNLEDHIQEKQRRKEILESKETELKNLLRDVQKLQKENDNLKSQIETHKSDFNKEVLKHKNDVTLKIQNQEKEIQDLKDKIKKYTSDLKEVEEEKIKFQQQNEQLKNYSEKEKEGKKILEAELSDHKTKTAKHIEELQKKAMECSERPGRKCFFLFMII